MCKLSHVIRESIRTLVKLAHKLSRLKKGQMEEFYPLACKLSLTIAINFKALALLQALFLSTRDS